MRSSLLLLIAAAVLFSFSAPVHAQFQPFGMDIEWISVSQCNPNLYQSDAYGSGVGYCPQLEAAARAGAQYLRFLTLWRWLEPNPPTGVPQPSVPGQRTGQHTYAWDTDPYGNQWDYYVNYCGSFSPTHCSGSPFQVIFTHVWAPAWARGSSCVDCSPLSGDANQCGDAGRSVQNTVNGSGYAIQGTDTLFDYYYNFAKHFQGASQVLRRLERAQQLVQLRRAVSRQHVGQLPQRLRLPLPVHGLERSPPGRFVRLGHRAGADVRQRQLWRLVRL